MSATTKLGRTRNRRGLAASAAPGGFPLLLLPDATTNVNTTKFRQTFADLTELVDQPLSVTLGAIFRLRNATSLALVNAHVTALFSPTEVEITLPAAAAIGEQFIIEPWNESIRGYNGEWVVPAQIVPRP